MKRKMLVNVYYTFEGKDHYRVFVKTGNNNVTLERGFQQVVDFYIGLQKEQGIRHLSITSELVFETRPMKFHFES